MPNKYYLQNCHCHDYITQLPYAGPTVFSHCVLHSLLNLFLKMVATSGFIINTVYVLCSRIMTVTLS